jgi:hypothetical protein
MAGSIRRNPDRADGSDATFPTQTGELSGTSKAPSALEKLTERLLWRQAHASICVQEGQPASKAVENQPLAGQLGAAFMSRARRLEKRAPPQP